MVGQEDGRIKDNILCFFSKIYKTKRCLMLKTSQDLYITANTIRTDCLAWCVINSFKAVKVHKTSKSLKEKHPFTHSTTHEIHVLFVIDILIYEDTKIFSRRPLFQRLKDTYCGNRCKSRTAMSNNIEDRIENVTNLVLNACNESDFLKKQP